MLQKINQSSLDRDFMTMLYPGSAISDNETGIGSIGRIDHAKSSGNKIIPMHPHVNDEILSYFRSGQVEHRDSEGFVEIIGKNKLMLMKAGKLFFHEEKMYDLNEPFEGLQIFIRPGTADLKPEVVFLELESLHSENKWRLFASPIDETTFKFSSQTWIYDIKLLRNSITALPELSRKGLTSLLYVFNGKALVNNSIDLSKKESLLVKEEQISITTDEDTELVLLVTDEQAETFNDGMYSGNQKKR